MLTSHQSHKLGASFLYTLPLQRRGQRAHPHSKQAPRQDDASLFALGKEAEDGTGH